MTKKQQPILIIGVIVIVAVIIYLFTQTDKPPPLTKYLSTPGGKAINPGFRISKLVWLFSIYSYTISVLIILSMDIDS